MKISLLFFILFQLNQENQTLHFVRYNHPCRNDIYLNSKNNTFKRIDSCCPIEKKYRGNYIIKNEQIFFQNKSFRNPKNHIIKTILSDDQLIIFEVEEKDTLKLTFELKK